MTVQELRSNGYKVRVSHFRRVGKKLMSRRDFEESGFGDVWGDVIQPFGGMTLIEVTDPNGITVESKALCQSEENYNKRIGVSIALGRALKRLKETI